MYLPVKLLSESSESNLSNVNVNENMYTPVSLGDMTPDRLSDNRRAALRIAAQLADALSDWKSFAFFRKVASSVPEDVIRDVLVLALELPPKAIRRSRAAYFTSIIRKYMVRSDESRVERHASLQTLVRDGEELPGNDPVGNTERLAPLHGVREHPVEGGVPLHERMREPSNGASEQRGTGFRHVGETVHRGATALDSRIDPSERDEGSRGWEPSNVAGFRENHGRGVVADTLDTGQDLHLDRERHSGETSEFVAQPVDLAVDEHSVRKNRSVDRTLEHGVDMSLERNLMPHEQIQTSSERVQPSPVVVPSERISEVSIDFTKPLSETLSVAPIGLHRTDVAAQGLRGGEQRIHELQGKSLGETCRAELLVIDTRRLTDGDRARIRPRQSSHQTPHLPRPSRHLSRFTNCARFRHDSERMRRFAHIEAHVRSI